MTAKIGMTPEEFAHLCKTAFPGRYWKSRAATCIGYSTDYVGKMLNGKYPICPRLAIHIRRHLTHPTGEIIIHLI